MSIIYNYATELIINLSLLAKCFPLIESFILCQGNFRRIMDKTKIMSSSNAGGQRRIRQVLGNQRRWKKRKNEGLSKGLSELVLQLWDMAGVIPSYLEKRKNEKTKKIKRGGGGSIYLPLFHVSLSSSTTMVHLTLSPAGPCCYCCFRLFHVISPTSSSCVPQSAPC